MPRSEARLRFLKETDSHEWPHADRRLETLLDMVRFLVGVTVVEVTSFYRPEHRTSPHGWHRAIDLRVRDWPPNEAQRVAYWLNTRFRYSTLESKAGLWVCLFGTYDPLGGHDDHMHLQVPPPGEKVTLRRIVDGV